VQQEAVDLVVELAVEPLQQAAGLGAFAGVAAQQAGSLSVSSMCSRMARVSQTTRLRWLRVSTSTGVMPDGFSAGELGRRFPVADLHLDERQPLLAQRQTHLSRGGIQGEMVKGAFDAHAQVRSGCIKRAMRRFA
jgi:hypothetical protein